MPITPSCIFIQMAAVLAETLEASFARGLAASQVCTGTALAIALSGGADSVALTKLAANWATKAPHPVALVVDHNLRPDSAQEAAQACSVAQSLGLPAKVITLGSSNGWPPAKRGELLSLARKHRYQALHQECATRNIPVILTAHHADDQAETFLIRFSKASGIDGLAGMPASTTLVSDSGSQVQLVRPLLGVRKAQLEQFCRDQGLHWVEDPTNQDTSFMRNLLRQRLAQCSAAARLPFSGRGEGGSAVHSATASLPAERVRAVDDSAKRRRAQCSQSDADLRLSHGDGAVADGEATASSVVSDILRLSSACGEGREMLEQRTAALVSAATNCDCASDTPDSSSEMGKTSGGQQRMQVSSVDRPLFVNLRLFRGANRHIGIRALVQILQAQSGKEYPPRAASVAQLWERVKSGSLQTAAGRVMTAPFESGKCLLHSVPRTQGQIVCIRCSSRP